VKIFTYIKKKIAKIINSEEKKILAGNFFSLSVLQFANYVLPLITIPYLVRVLGPERFGLIAFAQAFVNYFVLLTDFGFNLSATQEISAHRNDQRKISTIFSSVILIKMGLLGISAIILTLLLISIPKFGSDWIIYAVCFLMVIGQVLFPLWLFQGLEKMKYITILNLAMKIGYTIAIFLFVRTSDDFLYVALLNSLGYIGTGLVSLVIAFRVIQVTFSIPSKEEIRDQVRRGWQIFISTLVVSLYTSSNTFFLGIFSTPIIVGYFSASEKIINVVRSLFGPIFQSLYPFISKKVVESKDSAIHFIKKLSIWVGGLSLFSSILLFLSARIIVKVILGPQYTESILLLKILSLIPFVTAMSNIFGIQTMLSFKFNTQYLKIFSAAGLSSIVLSLVLVPLYHHVGISISILITESFVAFATFLFLVRKKIFNVKWLPM
jgi:PST family polysaccharide transporter